MVSRMWQERGDVPVTSAGEKQDLVEKRRTQILTAAARLRGSSGGFVFGVMTKTKADAALVRALALWLLLSHSPAYVCCCEKICQVGKVLGQSRRSRYGIVDTCTM